MKKLLLSFVIIVSIGLVFNSCSKEEEDMPDLLKAGDLFYGSPEYGGDMEIRYASGSFEYTVSGGDINLYMESHMDGTMAGFSIFGDPCLDGDTIKVVNLSQKKYWFKGYRDIVIKIIAVE